MTTRFIVTAALVVALFAGGVAGLVNLYRSGAAPEPVAATAPAAPAPPVGLATSTTPLGTLVTKDGFTLYRFDKDKPKPPKSNCSGDCATTWPPVLVDGAPPQIEGVAPDKIGTLKRDDGKLQLTIGNWAAYTFSGDKAPGDTKGEGVGGTWFALGVDGKKASASKPVALATAESPLGTVITQDGFTLYRFDKDSAKPPTSNCSGKCATTWPPVLAQAGAPQLTGIDPKLVGTLTRADGTKQVTVGGWALYRFSGDKLAGDINGQGVGGTWFAAAPDGKKAVKTLPAPAAETSGGGY